MNDKTLDLMFDMGMFSNEIIEFYKDYELFLYLINYDYKLAKFLLQSNKRPSYLKKTFESFKIETVMNSYKIKIDELLSKPSKEVEELINEYRNKSLR
ncbi:hypothetical protein CRV00_09925 [Malaciobacter molluscorum]|uniref:hypothetical protein n=1 Tax=Malaciobacter molluscorum TaxID=1032072 RepID=UPI00100B88D2|nr:hypothetical protein [Malaciobacter molluscorum]RXJ93770.1 hypothetical protein CRV00_09925 [Malaciobacter molluscorum]